MSQTGPAEVVDALVRPDYHVSMSSIDGPIVTDVARGRHRHSLAGILRDKVGRVPNDESWDALRDAMWRTPGRDRRGYGTEVRNPPRGAASSDRA
jgi:hypothetical protein